MEDALDPIVCIRQICSNQAMQTANMPQPVDLVVEAGWIIPIEPAGIVLERHAVAVRGGLIEDIVPVEAVRERFVPTQTIALHGEVLFPGLVNLHTHAAMSLLRGYADDLPLMRWLQERIWPAEARHVTADFVEAGTLLAAAEMVRGGVTCFNDMYFHPTAAAAAASKAGIRAMLGMIVIEFPTAYAGDAEDYLAKGLDARDACADNPLIDFCFAPHAPYTVSDRSFERVATLAAQLNCPIHVHLHETEQEISESVQRHGCRPIARFDRLGLLSAQLLAVHSVHLLPSEIDLFAHHGVHVAHCPTSNLKLAAGIAPMAALEARGVNFGLGTDGAASNNRLDVFHEMRHAALLAKGASGDATAISAFRALHAATLGGARALGMDDRIGSLRPGKAADMVSVRLDDWESLPCFDPISHLVYVAGREHVQNVWVGGNAVLQNGELTCLNPSALRESAQLWHNRLVS